MANVGGRGRAGERTFPHKPIVTEIVPDLAWTEDDNNHYLLVDLPEFKTNEVKLQVDTSQLTITVSGERFLGDKTKIIRFERKLNLPSNSDVDEISGKLDGEILCVTVPKRAVGDRIVEETTQSHDTSKGENAEVFDDDAVHGGRSKKEESRDANKDENAEVLGDDKSSEEQSMLEGLQAVDDDHRRLPGCCDDKKDKNQKVDNFPGELVEKWGKEPSQTERAINILKRNKGIVFTAIVAFSLGVMVSRNFGSASRPEQCYEPI